MNLHLLDFTVNVGKYTIHGLFGTWKMGDNPACYVYQKVGFNSLCFTVKVGIVETPIFPLTIVGGRATCHRPKRKAVFIGYAKNHMLTKIANNFCDNDDMFLLINDGLMVIMRHSHRIHTFTDPWMVDFEWDLFCILKIWYIPKKHHIQVGYMNNKPPKRGNLQDPWDGGQMAAKAEGGFMSLEHRRGKKEVDPEERKWEFLLGIPATWRIGSQDRTCKYS